jgi:hypothetical protein
VFSTTKEGTVPVRFILQAIPWFWLQVAGLSPPGFNPRPYRVRGLVDQLTIGQVLSRVFRNSSVSIVTTLRPGRYGVLFPAGATNFSRLANALTSPGIHPAASSIRTEGGPFFGAKVAEA